MYKNVEEIQQTDNQTCGSCYKVFTGTKTRKLHEKLFHGKDKNRIQCEMCAKSFASKSALDYHKMQTHALQVTKYSCEICARKFKSETSLKRHIMEYHESQDWNKCELCSSKFKRKDMLTRHMREVYNETNVNHHYSLNSDLPINLVNPYNCKLCGKRFKRKEHIRRHEKIMNCQKKKTIECHQCHKTFSDQKTLKQHIALVHVATSTYKCGKCDFNFVRKGDLLRHEENVHAKKPVQIKCDNCDKSFRRRDNLLKHVTHCKTGCNK